MNESKPLDATAQAVRRIEKAGRAGAQRLNLSGLGLTAIPAEGWEQVGALASLREIYLNNNQLAALPASVWLQLGRLADLQVLYLNGNRLTAVPDAGWENLRNLRKLTLNHNRIAKLPSGLGNLTNLRELYLSGNEIISIPREFGFLSNLQVLDLKTNRITEIPRELGKLADLRKCDLSNNRLPAIPEELGHLAGLAELDLSGNQIRTIPKELGGLASLTVLHLNHNKLVAIPKEIGHLRFLTDLDLSNNQLKSLPGEVGQLERLRQLHLYENQITMLPEELGRLTGLRELLLHGNPGLNLPAEVLGPTLEDIQRRQQPRPCKEILAYYFAQRAGSRPLNEAKLILVGQGSVGKTSLVNKLTTGQFNPTESTTHGIRITDAQYTLAPDNTVALHIWDFGGQEMLHATHRFFLTTRSLYLLVLDRRLGEHDLQADYWFRMIHTYGGPDAPVIVVLNKQRTEPFDVNRGRWLELYGQSVRFVATDCEDDTSISLLAEEIRDQLAAMKSVREGFPHRWFAIKDALARMKRDFVEYRQYQRLCVSNGVLDAESQRLLAGFLHDLGIALHYTVDPRLHFAYVLKPEWVTEGIYTLLHAPAASLGVLTPEQAREALDATKYPDEAVHFLLGLLERFELSFALNDNARRILVPQLLADRQPEEVRDFRPAGCLNFGYEYPVLPEGLLPRFVVRTHHLSQNETRWKSGVILQHGNRCRALVRAEAAARQVRIHVTGEESDRRDLLAIIRHNFDVIHREYKLDAKELVYAREAPERELSVTELQTLRDAGEHARILVVNGKVLKPEIDPLLQDVEESGVIPLQLFLSYAHEDAKYVERLRKNLKVMERNGLIGIWYDRELYAGQQWKPEILRELNDADAIICQLSPDFLASDFCLLTELAAAIRRQTAGEAALIAYVLRTCGWKRVDQLSGFQLLPSEAKPLRDWRDPDRYWEAIVDGIETALGKLQRSPRFRARRKREHSVRDPTR